MPTDLSPNLNFVVKAERFSLKLGSMLCGEEGRGDNNGWQRFIDMKGSHMKHPKTPQQFHRQFLTSQRIHPIYMVSCKFLQFIYYTHILLYIYAAHTQRTHAHTHCSHNYYSHTTICIHAYILLHTITSTHLADLLFTSSVDPSLARRAFSFVCPRGLGIFCG